MRLFNPSFRTLAVALALVALAGSSCLKTRAQLREDGDDDARPATAGNKAISQPVQDVPSQGGYAIDEIKSEITRLTGRLEDLERQKNDSNTAAAATNATKEDLKKLETRITELETAQANMLEAIKKLQETDSAAAADPNELYEKAKNQVEAKNFEGAIENLDRYLKSPGAKHTQDATFLRGEAYYNTKQFKKAIVDYSKFPEKYTKSALMPAALYKIGLSFEQLGMKDDAKGFFQELTEKFPKSSEAKKARAKLK